MDPDACLKRWVEALREGDADEAAAAAQDYNEWCARGGFLGRCALLVSRVDDARRRVQLPDGAWVDLLTGNVVKDDLPPLTDLSPKAAAALRCPRAAELLATYLQARRGAAAILAFRELTAECVQGDYGIWAWRATFRELVCAALNAGWPHVPYFDTQRWNWARLPL